MGRSTLILIALLALSIPALGQRAPRVSGANALIDPTEAQFKAANHLAIGTDVQAFSPALSAFSSGTARAINAVTDFGATGNGTTDDTSALQAALDAGKSQTRPVYIPSGVYKITSTLVEYWTGMVIYGDGQGTNSGTQGTIIKQVTANQGGLSVPCNPDDFLYIHDLQFYDASTSNTGVGLYLNGTASDISTPTGGNNIDDSQFSNVTVNGFGTCLEAYGVANSLFMNCSWTGNSATTTCVYFHGNNNSDSFITCPLVLGASTAYGYHLTGGRGCLIQGGDMVGNSSGAGNEVYSDGAVGIVISGCNVENYGSGNPIVFASQGGCIRAVHFNPEYKMGTTGAYAIQIGNGAGATLENEGGLTIRIDWDGTGHSVTSTSQDVLADLWLSGVKGETIPLAPVSPAPTLPSLYIFGASYTGHNEGAIEWDNNGGSTWYAMRQSNTVVAASFDIYHAASQDMATSPVVDAHFQGGTVTFPGTVNAQTGLQLNGVSAVTNAANTWSADQTAADGVEFVSGPNLHSPGNSQGGFWWWSHNNSGHNWNTEIDSYQLNDWGLFESTASGTVPSEGTTANPNVPRLYFHGGLAYVGFPSGSIPSGGAILNVNGTLNATGAITQSGVGVQPINANLTALSSGSPFTAGTGITITGTWPALTIANSVGSYTFSTGLTNTSGTITINASQSISTLSNLTGNGFVKTSGGTGALSIDATTYLSTTGSGSSLTGLLWSQIGSTPTTAAGYGIANGAAIDTLGGKSLSGTGALVCVTSPTLVTPALGAATATSLNGLTITSSTGVLTITNGKTSTFSNTLTIAGTDGSTLNVGTGGTLGTAAYTASSAYQTPLTFGGTTGLTNTAGTVSVNTVQFIQKLSNLTTNGNVKTSSGDGTISVDTTAYVPQTTTVNGHALSSNVTVTASDLSPISSNLISTAGAGSDNTSGVVGYYVSSTVSVGSAVSLTSGSPSTVTSISLGAGVWDVTGVVDFHQGALTTGTYFQGGVSTVTNSIGSQDQYSSSPMALAAGIGVDVGLNCPVTRLSVSGTTTVYLTCQAGFSTSTLSAYGTIRARLVK